MAASVYGLENHGLTQPAPRLLEPARRRRSTKKPSSAARARSATDGPFVVNTGKHTARAAADKFIVRERPPRSKVWWGEYNRPVHAGELQRAAARALQGYLQGRDVFVQDCYAGADPDHRLPIRIITEKAWHSLFARTMFLKPRTVEDATASTCRSSPSSARPGFQALARSSTARAPRRSSSPNFAERLAIIGGSSYARRDQEDHLHRAELPAAARRRAADALLGQRRRRRRRRRSSSASRAPARRRSRPTRRAS